MNITKHLLQLITCCLFLMAIAINREQRLFNVPITEFFTSSDEAVNTWTTADGYRVISTQHIAKDIFGYGGNLPLHIYLKNEKIERIEVQKNSETPEFLSSVLRSDMLSSWSGLRLADVPHKPVDAVAGATMSSSAIIESVQRAAQFATHTTIDGTHFNWRDVRMWFVIIVILCAMILPLYYKNKYYRPLQLLLNVIVLGFWSGSFISLSLLVNFFANGINVWLSLVPLLLLTSAFIFPLLGKKSHYCNWICPMGSCQELLGKSIKYKLKIGSPSLKYLDYFREGLWISFMAVMWIGIGFEAMDYELFSVFIFKHASIYMLVVGGVFALLSCVVQRPYCRFVCPTGSLLKFSQQNK
ncbi:MAG: FMN-binding protein [Bacteroidales bacterium]